MNEVRYITTIESMLQMVDRFHREILDFPIPEKPQMLDTERKQWASAAFKEEMAEFLTAETLEDEADALLDLVYFALGRILEMGLAPLPLFRQINNANMLKVRGEISKRPGAKGYDAIKPEGWTPPDLQPYLHLDWPDIMRRANEHLIAEHKERHGVDVKKWVPQQLEMFVDEESEGDNLDERLQDRPKTMKDTKGKAPLSRIPFEGLKMTADVFAFGAEKYSWNGYKVTPSPYTNFTDALIGHALAFANGQDLDHESRLNHIGHMGCNVMMLAWVFTHRKDMDNRKENMEGKSYEGNYTR